MLLSSKDLGKNVITEGHAAANGSLTKKQLTKTSELTNGGSLYDDGTKTIIKQVCCCTTMQKNRFGQLEERQAEQCERLKSTESKSKGGKSQSEKAL